MKPGSLTSIQTTLFILFCLLWIKAIYPGSSGIADSDFYWHIGYGRWMLEHGHIPEGDVFSWTHLGTPYRLTQWLGEVIMGYAYNEAGLHGTKILSVILAGAVFVFSWRAAARYVSSQAAVVIATLCNVVQLVMAMRPQMFSFAAIAMLAWLLSGWQTTKQHKYLYALPFLMAFWVNLHGGYVLGIVIIILFFCGQFLDTWLATRNIRSTLINQKAFALAVVASFVATLINPYGIGAWESVLLISGLQSSLVISEWQPITITTELGWMWLMYAGSYLAALYFGRRLQPTATELLMAAFLLFFGALANRQVAMTGAFMAPFIAAALARTEQYQQGFGMKACSSYPKTYTIAALCMLSVFPKVQSIGDQSWESTIDGRYPVSATRFLREHHLTDRLLVDSLEASYLVYSGIPVFIDGRMDLYKDKFFFEWFLAYKGAPGWHVFLEKTNPSAMLLRNDMALRQLVLSNGEWKLVYEDSRYSVLTRATTSSSLPDIQPSRVRYLDDTGKLIRKYEP